MNEKVLPVVSKTKILGTLLTDTLSWNENTKDLVKKGNMRLLLLKKAKEYTNSISDLKLIYTSYVRSVLETSCVVWHSSLTEEIDMI